MLIWIWDSSSMNLVDFFKVLSRCLQVSSARVLTYWFRTSSSA